MTLPKFAQPITQIDPSDSVPAVPAANVVDGWELLEDITVGADAQQVDITGLDGDEDELYHLIVSLRNPDAVNNADMTLRVNGDSGANYHSQMGEFDGAGVVAARTTALSAFDFEWEVAATEQGLLTAWLGAAALGQRTLVSHALQTAVNVFGSWTFGSYGDVANNITQLSLISSNPATIGIGSRLWLFRPSR